MRVWLVNPWEPNPLDDLKGRLWRTGSVAEALTQEGHEVTWWASNFRHMTKEFRLPEPRAVELDEGYTLHVLPALGYRRNISVARLRDHRYVAERFRATAEESERPDLVVASYPTIDLAYEAAAFGRRHDIPVVVDVRDQWPDTFYDAFPKIVHGAIWLLTRPLSRRADQVFRMATAIMGNGPGAVEWGLDRAGRAGTELDASFPMGYPKIEFEEDALRAAERFWRERGIHAESGAFVVAFLGTMTRHFDFDTILEAGRRFAAENTPVHFVCCGSGADLEALREASNDIPTVSFPGWVEAPQIHVLLRLASVGIAPYRDRKNFEDGITNKPVEYLSAGLPIATTLRRGALREALEEGGCGLYYAEGKPDELVDRLESLWRNPQRLREMSDGASRLFRTRFEWSKVYGAMAEHLALVERERRQSPHAARGQSGRT